MRTIGIGLLVGIGIFIIITGGSWIFDRSGPASGWMTYHSGSMIDRYQTPTDTPPRIADSDIITDYTHEGVLQHTARTLHPQQSLVSDLLWIRNIQQVGKFVLRDSVPGLFGMMDNLTALSPSWAYPYAFIQYIGPRQPPQGEQPGPTEQQTRQQTINLGERGMRMICDQNKINMIDALSDTDFVTIIEQKGDDFDRLREPCTSYKLPHTLGFNYFYYLKDLEQAIYHYKIAAFHEHAPRITVMMPALLRSRQGAHLISAQLRFDRAMALSDQAHDDTTIQEQYTRALHKAINEIQIHLLEQADHATDECAHDYACLLRTGTLRSIIQSLRTQCTTDATLSEQVQCILLQQGLEQQYINPNGALISPFARAVDTTRIYDNRRGGRKTDT